MYNNLDLLITDLLNSVSAMKKVIENPDCNKEKVIEAWEEICLDIDNLAKVLDDFEHK